MSAHLFPYGHIMTIAHHWLHAGSQMEVILTCKVIRDEDLPCSDSALFLYDPITVTISCVCVKLQADLQAVSW